MEENLSKLERNYASTRRRANSVEAEVEALEKELLGGMPDPEPSAAQTVSNEAEQVSQGAEKFGAGLEAGGKRLQQVAGGIGDTLNTGLKNGYEIANEVEGWLIRSGIQKENFIEDKPEISFGSGWAPPPTDGRERTMRGVGRFVTQFAAYAGSGAATAIAGAPAAVATGVSLATGAAVSALTFDPHEEKLADLLQQHSPIQLPFLEYLAADENDTNAEKRFKKVAEDLILDVTLAGLFTKVGKFYKAARAEKAGVNEVVSEAVDASKVAAKEGADDATQSAAKAALAAGDAPEAGARVALKTGDEAAKEAAEKTTLASDSNATGEIDSASEAALKSGDATAPVEAAQAARGQPANLGPKSMAAQGDSYKITSVDEAARAVGQDELSQVGRINLDMVDDNLDLRAVVANVVKENVDLLEKTARGVVTDDEVKAGALDLITGDPSKLLIKQIGEGWSPEEARAAKILFESAAEDVYQKVLIASADSATDEELQSAHRAMLILNKWMAPRQAASAEAGRTVRQFGVDDKLTRVPLEKLFASKDLLNMNGGREQLKRNSKMLAAALSGVPEKDRVKHFKWMSDRTRVGSVGSMIEEYRINAMLSSPRTMIKNVASNMLTAAALPLEKFGAVLVNKLGLSKLARRVEGAQLSSMIGKPLELITAQDTEFANAFMNAPVTNQEATASLIAGYQGLVDGWKAFKKGMLDGDAAYRMAGSKMMSLQRPRAITAANAGLSGTIGRAFDFLGSVVNIPGRVLHASDMASKTLVYRMESNALAYRTALARGTSADEMAATVKDLVDFPPPNITMMAAQEAAERTFSQEPEIFKKFYQAINENWVFRVAVPFAKVDLNMVDQTMQRLPILSYLSPKFQSAMRSGGTARDVALSKVALGTTVMFTGAMLAANGVLTGKGPQNRKAKKLLEETGWQPYSVKIGDTYISYDPLEGIGQGLRMAADMHAIAAYMGTDEGQQQSLNDLAISSALILADSATPDFLSDDFGKFITMISDETDPNKVRTYLQKQVTSFIPNISRDIKKATDPASRDASAEPGDDVWDMMLKPAQAMVGDDDLTIHRDLFGEEILYAPGTGPGVNSAIAFVNPFKTSKQKNDIVREELVRLGVSGPIAHPKVVTVDGKRQDHLMIDAPPRTITMSGGSKLPSVPLDLSNEQYSRFVQLSAGIGLSGNLKLIAALPPERRPKLAFGTLRENMETLIKSGYTEMTGTGKTRLTKEQLASDQVKRIYLKEIVSKFRAVASKQMLLEYPDLREKLLTAKAANARAVGIEVDRDIVANTLEEINQLLGVSSGAGNIGGEEQAPSGSEGGPRL